MRKLEPVVAADATPAVRASLYPEPFASLVMQGRQKRRLGDIFGLTNFGVNLTTLSPGGCSALRHAHARQDEFIYIISGNPTLHTDAGRQQLAPGICVGFKAGTGNAHRLLNETDVDASYLEVGDRTAGDQVVYPDDDLQAVEQDGGWRFLHKDGKPY